MVFYCEMVKIVFYVPLISQCIVLDLQKHGFSGYRKADSTGKHLRKDTFYIY